MLIAKLIIKYYYYVEMSNSIKRKKLERNARITALKSKARNQGLIEYLRTSFPSSLSAFNSARFLNDATTKKQKEEKKKTKGTRRSRLTTNHQNIAKYFPKEFKNNISSASYIRRAQKKYETEVGKKQLSDLKQSIIQQGFDPKYVKMRKGTDLHKGIELAQKKQKASMTKKEKKEYEERVKSAARKQGVNEKFLNKRFKLNARLSNYLKKATKRANTHRIKSTKAELKKHLISKLEEEGIPAKYLNRVLKPELHASNDNYYIGRAKKRFGDFTLKSQKSIYRKEMLDILDKEYSDKGLSREEIRKIVCSKAR